MLRSIVAVFLITQLSLSNASSSISISSVDERHCFSYWDFNRTLLLLKVNAQKLKGTFVLWEDFSSRRFNGYPFESKENLTHGNEPLESRYFKDPAKHLDLTISPTKLNEFSIRLAYQNDKVADEISVYETSTECRMKVSCNYCIDVEKELRTEDNSPEAMTDNMRSRRSVGSAQDKYFVELFLVYDFAMYTKFNNSTENLVERSHKFVNALDSIYRSHNVRMSLYAVEIWRGGDKIQFKKDPNSVLEQFNAYVKSSGKFYPADHVHLITGKTGFDKGVVGLAYSARMCTRDLSTAMSTDSETSTIYETLNVMAHEVGHSLGMSHDGAGCTCKNHSSCFMKSSVTKQPPKHFSSCSVSSLNDYLNSFRSKCLLNKPAPKKVAKSSCGNNIVEEGEQCDCGEEYYCNNPCCDAKTCKLTEGSQCFEGACCHECKIQSAGTKCRGDVKDCDLPDYCDGETAVCLNTLKEDGTVCGKNGICHGGECKSLDVQCEALWGIGAIAAPPLCSGYINKLGTWFGNCGNNGKAYRKCLAKDTVCGKLHCINKPSKFPAIGWNRAVGSLTLTTNHGTQHNCQIGIANLGRNQPDPTMVYDWTPCGEGNYCHKHECVPRVIQSKCDSCSPEHGACNNRGTCSCQIGWGGEHCNSIATTTTTTTTTPETTTMTTTTTTPETTTTILTTDPSKVPIEVKNNTNDEIKSEASTRKISMFTTITTSLVIAIFLVV